MLAAVQVHTIELMRENTAPPKVRPAVRVAVNVGMRERDLVVPVPVVRAAGMDRIVGVVHHSVRLDDVEAPVAIEVTERRAPAEALFVEGIAPHRLVATGQSTLRG